MPSDPNAHFMNLTAAGKPTCSCGAQMADLQDAEDHATWVEDNDTLVTSNALSLALAAQQRAARRHHATRKTPPAQLDREIAAALARTSEPVQAATPSVPKKITAKRAKDFRDSGNYEVRDETGALVALLFRDPESREWYEDQLPGSPQTHYTERWRGSSQAEALASITRRLAGT